MDTVKKGLRSIAKFLGLNRNSKYVNHYLMEANVRSMIYMTAVIVILEVWLIIYQHVKADGLIYLYNLVDDIIGETVHRVNSDTLSALVFLDARYGVYRYNRPAAICLCKSDARAHKLLNTHD